MQSALDFPDYRDYLREEFLKRLSKNPHYSLRAFSMHIGLAPSRVSLIFSRRQGLSKSVALSIGEKLGFEKNFLQHFGLLAEARHARSRTQRENALKKLTAKGKRNKNFVLLGDDVFRTISDWWHVAILQLGQIQGFDCSVDSIADKLNLEKALVMSAVERLARLGLLKFENSKVEITSSKIATTNNLPSSAIRSFHQQILEKAQQSIDTQSVDERHLSSLIIPMDVGKIESIVALIDDCKNNVIEETQLHQSKSDVYCLSIQLFNLTKKGRI